MVHSNIAYSFCISNRCSWIKIQDSKSCINLCEALCIELFQIHIFVGYIHFLCIMITVIEIVFSTVDILAEAGKCDLSLMGKMGNEFL